ncbi:hypothetical protein ACP4OV_007807 [Aristida adscensionis]
MVLGHGPTGRNEGKTILRGTAVLRDDDSNASLLHGGHHRFLGRGDRVLTFKLVSATVAVADPAGHGGRGKLGSAAPLHERADTLVSVSAREAVFRVNFEWDEPSQGVPGAVVVKNQLPEEVFLKTLTLDGDPGADRGAVVFVANSWLKPLHPATDTGDAAARVFFTNDTYLPSKMPAPLVPYRQEELKNLQGGSSDDREYKEHDRIYRYDVYNDLGEPEMNHDGRVVRPILGGSHEHPYPRRCRTGRQRHMAKAVPDSEIESRLSLLDLNIYVPRDERFADVKMKGFLGNAFKAAVKAAAPTIRIVDLTPNEFDSFDEILKLYETGKVNPIVEFIRKLNCNDFLRILLPDRREHNSFKMPLPDVIKSDVHRRVPKEKFGWRTDKEFAREMLAGVNPVIIRRLTEFPPKSNLNPGEFGDHTSKITEADIQRHLEGLTVQSALSQNRLFILDHHDHFMPYLCEINKMKDIFVYATRTLLLLKEDGTLKPLAIELSQPHPQGQLHGPDSTVYTPAHTGVAGHIWQLAKAYVSVNDSAWHQLISHWYSYKPWLNTHAVIEPFVIATHRQLSAVHPVHKLLSPHCRYTMHINALARHTLINAGGLFEFTVFPKEYALEMSSDVYRNWNLIEQALPDDLVKRGVAEWIDPSSRDSVRLLIEDYPYATDGLLIWSAIEEWVNDYLRIYYPNDGDVQDDVELQPWWNEVREVGHGDLKDRDWWPKMETVKELARTCTTIIWVASALHAAVNFGQYPYAGYLPNRPTVSRRPMPKPGSDDYKQLELGQEKADKVFLRTITSQLQTIVGVSLLEVLSEHSSDEEYLGQRAEPERWTSDAGALEAFKRFGERLAGTEMKIKEMNENPALQNRKGLVNMPYMLLYPNPSTAEDNVAEDEGKTGMGIPNSVSI